MISSSTIHLTIFGGASHKVVAVFDWKENDKLNLLSLLQKYQLPIASSCQGEGQCLKCTTELLVMQIKIPLISCLTSFQEVLELLNKSGAQNNSCQINVNYL